MTEDKDDMTYVTITPIASEPDWVEPMYIADMTALFGRLLSMMGSK